jgi:predicted transglutaminase-like cysteine proteinase
MLNKVKEVNRNINISPYAKDLLVYGKIDHWATPAEFKKAGAGDCEDFAIAKYFALKNKVKVRLAYTKKGDEYHVVVFYYEDDDPYVLDKGIDEMYRLSERADLKLIFTFDDKSIWLPDGRWVGSSSRLKIWKDLKQRMKEERLTA